MTVLWVPIAAAVVMSVAALATAWAQSRIGAAGAAALAEKPEISTTVVIMLAIPETVAVLGFVVAVMILMRGGS
jgi:V/A-type H+/Na+-transporting ATPase subunit K